MQDKEELWKELRNLDINANTGLPEELFLFVSGIVPIANVDLLLVNEKKQLLLTWRDDEFFGKGWHLPGGCIRYGETMLERVHKTAIEELGVDVIAEPEPLMTKDVILPPREYLKHKNERGHHLAVLFKCKLKRNEEISNGSLSEEEVGYMKWFDKLPENILPVHDVYNEILKQWK